ncbi:MAG: hypothetical protein DWQ01_03940 [Planctomycetota bacterium]|nr:MAG: hypothetical protein DWQ01_03940 [Planctomycetota bacterium]
MKTAALSLGLGAALLALTPACHIRFNTSSSFMTTGGYRFDRQGDEAQNHQTGELPAGATRFEIDHRFGKVEIQASSDTGNYGWEWELHTWADTKEEAEEFLGLIELRVEPQGETARFELVIPEPSDAKRLRGLDSRLTLRVPDPSQAKVENSFGPTRIEGIQGKVETRCAHGSLELKRLPGEMDVSTSFGNLNGEEVGGGVFRNQHGRVHLNHVSGSVDVSSSFSSMSVHHVDGDAKLRNKHGGLDATHIQGWIDAKTSFSTLKVEGVQGKAELINQHGGIRADDLQGPVTARTSFGSLKLTTAGDKVEVKNQHGSVDLKVLNAAARRVSAETTFGSLDVWMPPETQGWVDARTSFGKVSSFMPIYESEKNGSRHHIQGGHRGADLEITLRNSHGSIRLQEGH